MTVPPMARHSLGAHLATMMAVESGFWAVSFGSGGGERAVLGPPRDSDPRKLFLGPNKYLMSKIP